MLCASKRARKERRTLRQLHADLVALGYEGSYNRVAAFARRWKADRQREQQTAEMQLKREQMAAELQLRREQILAEVELKKEQLALEASIRIAAPSHGVGSDVRFGGAVG